MNGTDLLNIYSMDRVIAPVGDIVAAAQMGEPAGFHQLAADLQSQGAKSFDESLQNLLGAIETKGKELQRVS